MTTGERGLRAEVTMLRRRVDDLRKDVDELDGTITWLAKRVDRGCDLLRRVARALAGLRRERRRRKT